MRTSFKAALLAATLLMPLAACKQETADAVPPAPHILTADAVGHYCGMNLTEHPGPKGQVLLKEGQRTVWLSSVRDTFAFTMLPEEPKDYRAIYVTDVGKAADPEHPDLTTWVEARKAWYVVGSRLTGGMGEAEPFPFAEEAAAHVFAGKNGGTVKRFAEVSEREILTPQSASDDGHGVPLHQAEPPAGHDHGSPNQHGGPDHGSQGHHAVAERKAP
ncbi:MAG TPA: nitrous oxide reductase accessory protein NosL [Azospirillaceae bacterium]|nr:nitrous oxide reductase accessory protein NosL [Azospirillaceae bacterium]